MKNESFSVTIFCIVHQLSSPRINMSNISQLSRHAVNIKWQAIFTQKQFIQRLEASSPFKQNISLPGPPLRVKHFEVSLTLKGPRQEGLWFYDTDLDLKGKHFSYTVWIIFGNKTSSLLWWMARHWPTKVEVTFIIPSFVVAGFQSGIFQGAPGFSVFGCPILYLLLF